MTWCFRIRVDLRPTSKLECADFEWIIEQPDPEVVVKLAAADSDSLATARSITLRGSGYQSEEAATATGQRWRATLMAAFAAIRVGADFGDRAPHGAFMQHGLAMLSPGQRALNDVHGLMVFECDPAPMFARIGSLTGIRSSPHPQLEAAMAEAISSGGLSETRQVAYDLFAASFGQVSADARFALLMAALESMFELSPRSAGCIEHVDRMIKLTGESGLHDDDVKSMLGSLRFLRDESIGQAGRKLARTLEPRRYKDMPPVKFFTEAYTLRSRLMHGMHPLPTRQEVDRWAAPLEVFVADLLHVTG